MFNYALMPFKRKENTEIGRRGKGDIKEEMEDNGKRYVEDKDRRDVR